MKFAPFTLEEWFHKHYFNCEIILCVSGVEEFSFKEIRELAHISQGELDEVVFKDSPVYGNIGVRKAIAQRWSNKNTDHVMVTHGSSEALFLIANALLKQGDEVVILTPCYQPLFSIPQALGCEVKAWELRPDDQFVPDIERLKQLLSPRTRMVIVNFPNNPTGASLTVEQQEMLIQVLAEKNIYLLWDSAFTDLTYTTSPLPDPGLLYDKTITLGTLTKAYGLGGLRVGWCLASPEILEQCARIREYITLNLSPLIELIAQRIIENLDDVLADRLQQAQKNLAIVQTWIEDNRDFVSWVPPQGGVSAFVKILHETDVDEFCHQFAIAHGVFLLPGSCFGHKEYIRLGFGGSTHHLREGLSRLTQYFIERARRTTV